MKYHFNEGYFDPWANGKGDSNVIHMHKKIQNVFRKEANSPICGLNWIWFSLKSIEATHNEIGIHRGNYLQKVIRSDLHLQPKKPCID